MAQTRSVKMDERIVKFEENLDVKFNDHEEGMKLFIQNLFAEFKKKCFWNNSVSKKGG